MSVLTAAELYQSTTHIPIELSVYQVCGLEITLDNDYIVEPCTTKTLVNGRLFR